MHLDIQHYRLFNRDIIPPLLNGIPRLVQTLLVNVAHKPEGVGEGEGEREREREGKREGGD